jgi:hypothetical protein
VNIDPGALNMASGALSAFLHGHDGGHHGHHNHHNNGGYHQGEMVEDDDSEALDHIVAIGDASSQYGLLSTLVLAISLDKLLARERDAAHLLLVFVAGFSAYTATYSILESYYIKAVLAAFSRGKVTRMTQTTSTPMQGSSSPRYLEGGYLDSEEEIETLQISSFAELITPMFASLNRMRAAARNSMWMSVVCLLSAVSLFSGDTFDMLGSESQSQQALVILIWMDIVLAGGCYLFPDLFYELLFLIFTAITIPCAVDVFYVKSGSRTLHILTNISTVFEILTIARTVKIFRGTFVELIKSRTEVF